MEPSPLPPFPAMQRLSVDGSSVPSDVELWRLDLDGEFTIAAEVLHLLSDHEKSQLTRFHHQEDRARFALSRAGLRWVLAGRLQLSPHSLEWIRGPHGRPELPPGHALSFNVSHSGRHALIGVSRSRVIGVDIEQVRPELEWQELAPMVLTDDETATIGAQAIAIQADAFYRIWVAKEAVAKATGLGLSQNLRAFSASPADGRVVVATPGSEPIHAGQLAKMRVVPLFVAVGYEAALAYGPAE